MTQVTLVERIQGQPGLTILAEGDDATGWQVVVMDDLRTHDCRVASAEWWPSRGPCCRTERWATLTGAAVHAGWLAGALAAWGRE